MMKIMRVLLIIMRRMKMMMMRRNLSIYKMILEEAPD